MPFAVFELDGVLMRDNEPHWPMIEVFHSLDRNGNHVVVWTDIHVDSKQVVQAFLEDVCGIRRMRLVNMREDDRAVFAIKEEWLAKAPLKPDMWFDSDADVIEMVKQQGVVGILI